MCFDPSIAYNQLTLGLEPNEIKYAISEFRKFSPDDNGKFVIFVMINQ